MITNVLLSSLLILFSPCLGSLETEISDLLERVTRMEAAMEWKDETISKLQNELKQSNNRIAALEDSMFAKEKLVSDLDVKLYEVRERLAETEKKELEPPSAYQCAWAIRWTADYSTITFDRLTFDSMSGGSSYNVTGGMDIKTGVFSVGQGFSGVWSVTYSIQVM